MTKQSINTKKGFTIIEVVLVLAIAGLIFMMVFTALPALQRSQRDTQRGTDFQRLTAALQQYQSNNRGKIPTSGKVVEVKEVTVGEGADATTAIKVTVDGNPASGTGFGTDSWGYFYEKYLTVNSAGSNDTFEDPDGEPYAFIVSKCQGTAASMTAGQACDSTAQRNNVTFDEQSEGITSGSSKVSHAISVVTNATCDGENAVYSSGSRRVAMLYKKEGGGTFCYSI